VDSETWRTIDGYNNKYEVSDCGRVKSHHGDGQPRILSQSEDSRGYKKVNLCLNGAKDTRLIHRLVADAFLAFKPDKIGTRQGQYQLNHKDFDKTNNSVENLEWVTPKQNVKHAIRGGRHGLRGCEHGRSKLTPKAVAYARCQYALTDISQERLGEIWGVVQRTMSKALKNRKWKHVHVIEVIYYG